MSASTKQFLDTTGLNALWNKIKSWFVAKSGDTMSGRLTMNKAISQVLIGTGTAATSSTSGSTTTYYPALWKYNLSEANPTPGDRLVIKTPVAGSDYGEYISTDNGTTYYPVARNTGATRLTNQYPAGAYICVVFEEYVSGSSAAGQVNDIFPVAGATARVSQKIGCWRVLNDYDSGNTVSQIRHENGRFRIGSTGCNPYSLVCLDKNGTFSMLISSGSGTGTSKTINTNGKFKLDPVILWYSANNTTAANTIVTSTYATFSAYQAVDTRYSHNHTTTFTTNAPLYIECTIDDDGFWSPTTKCITQVLENGKYYIYLGMTYSTEYQLTLMTSHPLYYYDGTNLTQVPRLAKADRTKLDGIASGATKVESSTTNGNIKINGTETTVYTHPTNGANVSKGDTSNQTPEFGGTFKALSATVNSLGHTTSLADHTIKIPDNVAEPHTNVTLGKNGLMSATDKAKLDDIASGAEVNQDAFSNIKVGSTTISASSKTDTLELAEAATPTITLTPDSTNKKVTFDLSSSTKSEISGKQDKIFQKFEFDSTLLYTDVANAIIINKAVPYLLDSNMMYVCDGNPWSVDVSGSTTTEYRFVATTGNTNSPRISYRYVRANNSRGTGIISLATSSSVSSVASSRFPYFEVDNPDWDDLTDTGEYKVLNSAAVDASPSKHSPERGAINCRVYNIYDGNTPFITQVAVGDDMYYRSKYGSSNWSSWRYFIQSSDVRRIVSGSLGTDSKTFYVL